MSFTLPLRWDRAENDKLIGTLAARTMIQDLEEGSSALHRGGGSRQNRKNKDRVRDEIVRLGVTYGLCSRETSFVAVEMRDAVPGEMQLRRVPTALSWGWGGTDLPAFGGSGQARFRVASAPAVALGGTSMMGAPEEAGIEVEESICMEFSGAVGGDALDDGFAGEKIVLDSLSPAVRPMDSLVAIQRADGSWDLTEEFAGIVGQTLAELERGLEGAEGDRDEARRALATGLAIVWLQTEASEWKDEWTLLERKARKWLASCQAKLTSGVDWLDHAASFLPSE